MQVSSRDREKAIACRFAGPFASTAAEYACQEQREGLFTKAREEELEDILAEARAHAESLEGRSQIDAEKFVQWLVKRKNRGG